MSPESSDATIRDYIRANRDAFGREAIDRELQSSGHQPEDIAAAWAAIEAEDAPATPPMETWASEADPFVPVASTAPVAARDPAIARYIRENRGIYTRPAITASLGASGHAPADIEATWAEIAVAEAPPSVSPEAAAGRRAVLNSWRFWVTAIAVAGSVIVAPTILTIAIPDRPIGIGLSCVLMIGFVAAGLIMLGIGKARDVAYGLLAGVGVLFALSIVLALIGFILLVIVLGICLVILGQSGSGP